MKKVFLMVTALCLMLSMLMSCGNGPKGYKTTDSGLYYRFYTNNGGETPAIGDIIDITLSCTVNDTTPIMQPASNLMRMMEPQYFTDIMEGIAMMHIGDSASFIVNTDSTFYYAFGVRQLPEQFNSTDVMKFEVKLNDFYPESEYVNKMVAEIKANYPEETEHAYAEMQAYFAENQIAASPTSTGLYYVMTEEGNGEMPEKGDYVKVHYTGKLLDGTVFDSSVERGEPIELPIGTGVVIPGWDEGIMLMSKGEKGVLYIPYYLAYGPNGAGPVIPPFANLIFEVELIDFQKAQ
ncbi:MAG: FKBP-type peptidyl-prolyl cis-trans isomerase [Bacteroidales bacterium]|nr:FKBP-type peptidyl-prolyl cis-trans isomerase [Bacteroidales bacterium]